VRVFPLLEQVLYHIHDIGVLYYTLYKRASMVKSAAMQMAVPRSHGPGACSGDPSLKLLPQDTKPRAW
jgi:hypothetical protein